MLSSERHRQMGDGGVIAQRYALVLFGNAQKLELQPWQANPARSVEVPFAWKPETWYRVKFRVENRKDGTTAVQGKVWPAADPEPAAWTMDHVDRCRTGRERPACTPTPPPRSSSTTSRSTANK